MKVVMVTPFPISPPTVAGGVEAAAYCLVGQLRRMAGLDLQVIAPESNVPKRTTRNMDGIPVHYLPLDRTRGPLGRMLWAVPKQVAAALSELGPDLVHVQGWAWLASGLTWPSVLTVHGISERCVQCSGSRLAWLKAGIVALTDGRARSRVKNIICISPYVRQLLGRTRARIWDIENPVAPAFFEVMRQPTAGRILYGGHVSPLKNIIGLIRAVGLVRLSLPDVHLRIAGGGADAPYGKECRLVATDLGLADCVSFLGSLSPPELRREMAMASCLALCSFQETAPMIIEEAMAVGIPVVASGVGGVQYMVKNGETGTLVSPTDIRGIADALRTVLGDQLSGRMSERARQEAQQRFASPSVAVRTCKVYEDVLEGP